MATKRPSMSLSLPPTFARTPRAMLILRRLLADLSAVYVVTLISPPPLHAANANAAAVSNGTALFGNDDDDEEEEKEEEAGAVAGGGGDVGTASVAALAESLKDVDGFDQRRVLEYEKPEGRMSLGRALACDAHVEVLLQQQQQHRRHGRDSEPGDEEGDDDDGDSTPRAGSPVFGSSASLSRKQREKSKEDGSSLKKYQLGLEQLRKATGVLVVLGLASLQDADSTAFVDQRTRAGQNGSAKPGEARLHQSVELDPDQILGAFRDVPGVKTIDCRGAYGDEGWKEAAEMLVGLRSGWK